MKAGVDQHGSVVVDVTVDGRQAAVTFDGGEVALSVEATAGAITFQVPYSMVPQADQGAPA